MSTLTLDETPFYGGGGRQEALDALCRAGLRGGLVLLTGPTGAGVSRLLGEAAMALVDGAQVIRVDGAETPSRAVLMRAFLNHLGVGKDDFVSALEELLTRENLVLVVDHGEQMGDEALTTLGVLRERLGERFGVLVGGTPLLAERATALSLPASHEPLSPLSAEECGEFLALAGIQWPQDALQALQEQTGGWPGALLAQPLPDQGGTPMPSFAARRGEEDEEGEDGPVAFQAERGDAEVPGREPLTVPWKHLAVVLALILLIWLFWPKADDEVDAGPDGTRSLALPPAPTRTLDAEETAPEASSGAASRPRYQAQDYIDQPQRQTPVTPAEPSPASRTPDAPQETPPARRDAPPTRAAEAPSRPATPPATSTQGRAPQASTPPPASTPAPSRPSQSAASARPPATPPSAPAESSPPAGRQEAEAAPVLRVDQRPALSGLDAQLGYRSVEWLKSSPASQWMLQVSLATTEDQARALIDELGRDKAAYYRAERNGRQMYVVLSGPHADRETALKAREQLPERLRTAGPFPRPLSAIHGELR